MLLPLISDMGEKEEEEVGERELRTGRGYEEGERQARDKPESPRGNVSRWNGRPEGVIPSRQGA